MEFKYEVTPTSYVGKGKLGDFAWMQVQPEYANALFVFNDNEEQFDAFLDNSASGFMPGGGNAVARPWRHLEPAKSAGIPTGKRNAGYPSLGPDVKAKIDQALLVVYELLVSGKYNKLIFSADETLSTLGTGIFTVGEDVCKYVFTKLTQSKADWKTFVKDVERLKFNELKAALDATSEEELRTHTMALQIGLLEAELKNLSELCSCDFPDPVVEGIQK